jgi:hypothetical protein
VNVLVETAAQKNKIKKKNIRSDNVPFPERPYVVYIQLSQQGNSGREEEVEQQTVICPRALFRLLPQTPSTVAAAAVDCLVLFIVFLLPRFSNSLLSLSSLISLSLCLFLVQPFHFLAISNIYFHPIFSWLLFVPL